MTEFKIRGEHITLGQLLKASGMSHTGGEAKLLVEEGQIKVNGDIEAQRGRKLRPGDLVELVDGRSVRLL